MIHLKPWEVTRGLHLDQPFERPHRFTISAPVDPVKFSVVVVIRWEVGQTIGTPVRATLERLISGQDNDVAAVWEYASTYPLDNLAVPGVEE